MSPRRLFAIFVARNNEFLRDRTAMAWNILLPVFIVIGFAFAFTSGDQHLFKVGVFGDDSGEPALERFLQTRHIQFIALQSLEPAISKVDRHQLDMLLDLQDAQYWINSNSANGYVLERLLGDSPLQRQAVSGEEIRYVDWVVPGVLGMNVMFSSLFGIGFVIVRYRKNGVLKRLHATPLTAFEFLTAQVASRLLMILLVTSLVYTGTNLLVGFRMHGAYWLLFLILTAGTLSMISVGLLVAARFSSEEAANGILNLISWPMMLLSGVWFSLEGSDPLVQQFALLLPLTHMLDAARAVMIDGAGFQDVLTEIVTLFGFSALFLAIGARSFRWE
ncbi:ABC transporter permease [endosymbiont of Ridgeia piscesae]|jgi:ABC-type multidrug transport system permease subunit|uniref:Transport permease protein n=1 Tax=endosymbiont of Ridgeia piscesae TaxID=54398 RepID=A0A0T5Z6B0_9GAMM|nr:ABC transporter permease [endosymbiont of Ridgeia piscesae]KRT55914.1 ABC-type multidrug transport system, permease component [endosymbiont of Ridgeia piscesae]KRT58161.1 ABC-type multidrug transport system, permease component [endosymbiont of Ridgeia piscesae]